VGEEPKHMYSRTNLHSTPLRGPKLFLFTDGYDVTHRFALPVDLAGDQAGGSRGRAAILITISVYWTGGGILHPTIIRS
jgi:hypothetical protein